MNQPLKQLEADSLLGETYLVLLSDNEARYFQADVAGEAMSDCIEYLKRTDGEALSVLHITVEGSATDASFDIAETWLKQILPAWQRDNYWTDADDIHGFIIAHIPDIEARKEDAIEDYL